MQKKLKLNKEICIRCRQRNSWWNEFDEKRWSDETIACCVNDDIGSIKSFSINDCPSEFCKYFLEHILEMQKYE